MGSSSAIYPYVVVLHVVGAVVWVGGLIFIPTVLVPITRDMSDENRRRLLDAVGRQFRGVGWSAVAVSLLTGTYLLFHWGATWSSLFDLSFFATPHTRLLAYKLLLVAAMLVAAGLHDWWLAARAGESGRTGESVRIDRLAGWLARVAVVLALAVVAVAVFVARPRI